MAKGKGKRKEKKAQGRSEPTIDALDKKAELLEQEAEKARQAFLYNEAELKRKAAQKEKVEGKLAALLRKRFAEEKNEISRLKESSERKQEELRQKIVSLERINKIYAEKKSKIDYAKRRYTSLKKQLEELERQESELSIYA